MDFLYKTFYFLGIVREMIWEMHGECPHYSDYSSGIVPPKTAMYCGPHCGKFPSKNATHASHRPTMMSRALAQKSDVASQTCPYMGIIALNVPKKLIGKATCFALITRVGIHHRTHAYIVFECVDFPWLWMRLIFYAQFIRDQVWKKKLCLKHQSHDSHPKLMSRKEKNNVHTSHPSS